MRRDDYTDCVDDADRHAEPAEPEEVVPVKAEHRCADCCGPLKPNGECPFCPEPRVE